MNLCVGLTGGIASGKSLVADAFTALGVPVLDADQVARAVVAPGTPALARIAQEFGHDFLNADGSLNRPRMRAHVFADDRARRHLESLTHPWIAAEMRRWRDEQTTPYCILSIAILLETGMRELVQRVLVVDVPVALQLARLTARDGISEELARSMIAAQAARERRLAAAHDVIENSGSMETTQLAVANLHRHYLALAANAV